MKLPQYFWSDLGDLVSCFLAMAVVVMFVVAFAWVASKDTDRLHEIHAKAQEACADVSDRDYAGCQRRVFDNYYHGHQH